MIGRVFVVVFVAQRGPRAEHESSAELRRALAGTIETVAFAPSPTRCRPRLRVKELEKANTPDRSGSRSLPLVVDQDRERNVLIFGEALGMPKIAGSNDREISTAVGHLRIVAAQLRRVCAAMQSAKMPREDENGRTFLP